LLKNHYKNQKITARKDIKYLKHPPPAAKNYLPVRKKLYLCTGKKSRNSLFVGDCGVCAFLIIRPQGSSTSPKDDRPALPEERIGQ
jgi:hypothetical protein